MARWGRNAQDRLVYAFIGPRGSGKSYDMAERGCRALDEGRTVWVNRPYLYVRHEKDCDGEGKPFGECYCPRRSKMYGCLEEMLLGPGRNDLVVLDEAPKMFSARRWKDFPDALLGRLTEARKDGLQFMYGAIHEDFVDKVLRENTDWFFLCRRIPFVPLYIRTRWAPPVFRKSGERSSGFEFRKLRVDICRSYDTYGKAAAPLKVWKRLSEASDEAWITDEEWATYKRTGELPAGVGQQAAAIADRPSARSKGNGKRPRKIVDAPDLREEPGVGGMWVLNGSDEIGWRADAGGRGG